MLEKKYALLAEAEITSVKEAFERARIRIPITKEEVVATKEGQNMVNINPKGVMARTSLDSNTYEQAKIKYNEMIKENEETDNELPDTEEDETDEEEELRDAAGMTEQDMLDLTKVDRTQPYIINDREYSEEFPHHDKISLYYYRVDDVLCEENEEIIDDVDATIGPDTLSLLDTQTTVWVRNEPLAIDYEIIALNKSYAELAHGIHLKELHTPRERYNELQRRRPKDGE